MTKKQVTRFVKKISGGVNIPVRYVNDCGKDFKGCSAVACFNSDGIEILINKKDFKNLTDNFWKCILLHEVGHFNSVDFLDKLGVGHSVVMNELFAQLWAIKRADKLGMERLKRESISILKRWKRMNWNSTDRRYRLASNFFLDPKNKEVIDLLLNNK